MLPTLVSRENEKAALKQARQANDTKMIERLETLVEEVEVPGDIVLYYNAFLELDSERLFEGGPIPASAIRAWCSDYDLTFSQFDIMRTVIRKIDNVVMEKRNKKRSNGKLTEDSETGGNRRNRRQTSRA